MFQATLTARHLTTTWTRSHQPRSPSRIQVRMETPHEMADGLAAVPMLKSSLDIPKYWYGTQNITKQRKSVLNDVRYCKILSIYQLAPAGLGHIFNMNGRHSECVREHLTLETPRNTQKPVQIGPRVFASLGCLDNLRRVATPFDISLSYLLTGATKAGNEGMILYIPVLPGASNRWFFGHPIHL